MTEEKTTTGPQTVPYFAHEAALARLDRLNRRLALLLAASLVLTGAAWISRK